ncbi:hypothetical protein [Nostoc piscinale]|uniref:hypothetical protein n=1 Tax=Nostoc piscinale TaxID=224012 RepID=UPI000AFF6354|nr:hypothetical protein [Nostoc piscinale]
MWKNQKIPERKLFTKFFLRSCFKDMSDRTHHSKTIPAENTLIWRIFVFSTRWIILNL